MLKHLQDKEFSNFYLINGIQVLLQIMELIVQHLAKIM